MAKTEYKYTTVTIKESHLDNAIQDKGHIYTCHCVAAKAIISQIDCGLVRMGLLACLSDCGTQYDWTKTENRTDIVKLIRLFDKEQFDEVRNMLPITFEIREKV